MGILKFVLHAVTHAGWRLVIALLMLIAYIGMIVLRSVDMAEILGNLILLTGALLIARGVVLPKHLRAWHFAFKREQEASQTRYVDMNEVKAQQLWLVRQLSAGVDLASIDSRLSAELDAVGYADAPYGPVRPHRKELTSLAVSNALLEASEYGEAGTLVVVIGTLWLAGLILFKAIAEAVQ